MPRKLTRAEKQVKARLAAERKAERLRRAEEQRMEFCEFKESAATAAMALMMACHPRLGAQSLVSAVPSEILKGIVIMTYSSCSLLSAEELLDLIYSPHFYKWALSLSREEEELGLWWKTYFVAYTEQLWDKHRRKPMVGGIECRCCKLDKGVRLPANDRPHGELEVMAVNGTRMTLRVPKELCRGLDSAGIFTYFPDEGPVNCVHALIMGSRGSSFQYGLFCVRISFEADYPFSEPRMQMINRTPHDVFPKGHCLDHLNQIALYRPDFPVTATVKVLLRTIQADFLSDNLDGVSESQNADYVRLEVAKSGLLDILEFGESEFNLPRPLQRIAHGLFAMFSRQVEREVLEIFARRPEYTTGRFANLLSDLRRWQNTPGSS